MRYEDPFWHSGSDVGESSMMPGLAQSQAILAGNATRPETIDVKPTSAHLLRKLVALSKIVFLQKFLASMNVRLVEGGISNLFRSIENVAASD
jgi:hypothetical protein